MTDTSLIDAVKAFKKELAKGIILPVNVGLIAAIPDLEQEEYTHSKSIGGFIHQYPIAIHIRAGGAGNYDEFITKYLSLDEAKALQELIGQAIGRYEEQQKCT